MVHTSFAEIYDYLIRGTIPERLTAPGSQANFLRAAKTFRVKDSLLFYIRTNQDGQPDELRVLQTPEEIRSAIQEVHEGSGYSTEASAMRAHNGTRGTTYAVSRRFYWRTITSDVKSYIQSCDACQKTSQAFAKATPSLHPVAVPQKCMSQIGVDITSLPECDGYRYLVLAVDYFSKWTEGKPLIDKSAASVARFLYELICRHGCFDTQINDQGREFVNTMADEMHRLTGVAQRITSAYHPQSNGLVERQNRTVKEKLLKVLNGSQDGWVAAFEGVLFAHRTTVQKSTGYSPFFLLYGGEAKLPIDVSLKKPDCIEPTTDDLDDAEMLSIVDSMDQLRRTAERKAAENIRKSQESQKSYYNRRHATMCRFNEGQRVLLRNLKRQDRNVALPPFRSCRNLKRQDRKGGRATFPWKGPYFIKELFANNTCSLESLDRSTLTAKQHLCNLKPYVDVPEVDSAFLSEVNAAQVLAASSTLVTPTFQQLGLSALDRQILLDQRWLNDRIIDAGQMLLAKQFPVGGLQSTVLSETTDGFSELQHPAVQIHFDRLRSHWMTSASCRGRIELDDSLGGRSLASTMKRQIMQCYPSFASNGTIICYYLNVQLQSNGDGCGLHALATATEFLVAGGNPTSEFDLQQLRPHLLACLESGVMEPFPKNSSYQKTDNSVVASVYRFYVK